MPGSSMYRSQPDSPNNPWPMRVGIRLGVRRFAAAGSSVMSFAASPQKRMARTMFLPTPRITGASGRPKTNGSSAAAA